MQKRYEARGLVIVGVHTPEFENEKSRSRVETAIKQHDLGHFSHFLDNNMSYWRALSNEYWPAIYVVDRAGRLRGRAFGEIHVGTDRDKEMIRLVEKLLAEGQATKP